MWHMVSISLRCRVWAIVSNIHELLLIRIALEHVVVKDKYVTAVIEFVDLTEDSTKQLLYKNMEVNK